LGRSQSAPTWAPEPVPAPRCGPSGAPIARFDPPQLRDVPRVFDPDRSAAPERLLIAFPDGLGEFLMLGPALRALRRRLPGTSLVLLVRPEVAAADVWPASDPGATLAVLDRPAASSDALAAATKRFRADRAIGIAMPRRSSPWPRPSERLHAHRIFAAQLGVAPDSFRYEVPVGDEHRRIAASLFPAEAPPTVALSGVASSWRWSPREYRRMAGFLRARGYRVLHADPGGARFPYAAAVLPGDIRLSDLGTVPFLVLAAVLERCASVVAADSAAMHAAAAFGKSTVGIFSRGTPMLGHAFEPTHALLVGQPDADRVLAELERLAGGRDAVPLGRKPGAYETAAPVEIDFVIAAYNEERNLPRLLASLRANDVAPEAVTVVDKGSSDRTGAIAREFGARLLVGGRNSSEQRNIGADATCRPFLAFLDADMELVPGQVAEWTRLLEGAACLTIPEVSMAVDRLGRARSLERRFIGANPDIESARIFAREVFERAGGYRVDLYGCEDWVLSDAVVGSYASARATQALLHHEGVLSTPQIFGKYRRYGRGYFALLLENRRRFVRHARPLRSEMLSAIVAAGRRNPGLLLSWLQFRTITYAGGIVGFLEAAVLRAARRGR
jgi:hypothetical protein